MNKQLLQDIQLVETLAKSLHKTAQEQSGMASSLVDATKHYFSNNIDSHDPSGSFLNIIAPGAIGVVFSALGLGWLGWLLGLAMRVFHVDVKGILSSIYQGLKNELGSGKKVSSQQVDSIVQGAVQDHNKPATQEEAEAFQQQTKSSAMDFRQAMLCSLAIQQYANHKTAGLLSIFSNKKSAHTSLLGKVLSLFFKVAVASAGLMIAGDAINAVVGRPSAFTDTVKDGKPVEDSEEQISLPVATQTKFPLNPSYQPTNHPKGQPWVISAPNDDSGIANVLLQFSKLVYRGLEGLDSQIENSSNFQSLVNNIAWYNHNSKGGPVIYIPSIFRNEKQLVDMFIDQVAENSTGIIPHDISNPTDQNSEKP
jgi:hypothetical protein